MLGKFEFYFYYSEKISTKIYKMIIYKYNHYIKYIKYKMIY